MVADGEYTTVLLLRDVSAQASSSPSNGTSEAVHPEQQLIHGLVASRTGRRIAL